ncbi:hypothetical protein BGX34_002989 [Mortierella sp. NVP85]|nr:hypothetical protein BGX34_002989 [Mortierella sp. NVP85]
MPSSWTTTLVVSLALAVAAHQYLERRALSTLSHIHTDDTLYDKDKYRHILDYDKHSIIIHGQPTLILSGEFHYWRLPDKTRWKPILEQYRSAGLNCIRIYFHWGFHSPAPGRYLFDGNRDIEYLLQVCEELGLYVLAAPGPYICAETQAGGFPIWLAAMREIRLRHMKTNFWKTYDPEFMFYCAEYFEHILPILARHQITNGANGCVIGLQIENESFQRIFGYPIGLHEDMRVLAQTARKLGITVPLFTNDGFEEGSFIVKDDPKQRKKEFGVDLYGFDKYVVFTPNSEPTSWVMGRDPSYLQEWDPSTVMSGMDQMESTVRSFGHANRRTPIFIPELQGGWFNHYGIKYTYDAIYRFYGDQYTRLMLDTSFSQGCTMLNFYMFYGGTNWGTLGDADVYTSYDYSASIREFGLMSGRLRNLRLGMLFLQSFSDIMTRTDPVVLPFMDMPVRSNLGKTISQQRQSRVAGEKGPVGLTFVRNFSDEKQDRFELIVRSNDAHGTPIRLSCHLAYKSSFIALGNYTTLNPAVHLLLSATPIHVRGFTKDGKREVWIAALAASGPTEMAFSGEVDFIAAHGTSRSEGVELRASSEDRNVRVLSVAEGTKSAYALLSDADGDLSKPSLHIIFLDQAALSTLYCHYDNRHADGNSDSLGAKNLASTPKVVSWGSYNALYDPREKTLKVESTESQEQVHVLGFDSEGLSHSNGSPIYGPLLPYRSFSLKGNQSAVLKQNLASHWTEQSHQGISFLGWETRTTDFGSFQWTDCPRASPTSDRFQLVNFDYKFTSGHILYRGTFKTRELVHDGRLWRNRPVWLKINIRHRVIAFVNGICIGSHMTYSRQLLTPGAKMGYDPVRFGSHSYFLPSEVLGAATATLQKEGESEYRDQEHQVILVIDSFGLSRQPFVVDDIRNPRGLLSASVRGKGVVEGSEHWQVAGVDVTGLDMAYGSTGFPDEHSQEGWEATTQVPQVIPDKGVTWWRTRFEGPPSGTLSLSDTTKSTEPTANIPLCCRLEGEFSAMILLNDVLVGRYFGSDSPQHEFYLMDGLVHKTGSGQLNELKLMIYGAKATTPTTTTTGSDGNNTMSVRILPWIVEDAQGCLGQWSGNTAFGVDEETANALKAGPFWTVSQTFVL